MQIIFLNQLHMGGMQRRGPTLKGRSRAEAFPKQDRQSMARPRKRLPIALVHSRATVLVAPPA